LSLASSLHVVSTTTPCRVGILGFGTVGSAVARRLTGPDAVRGLTLTHVCDRRADQKRASLPHDSGITWTTAIDDLLRSDVHVIVETVGGVEPAAGWIREALLAGKSVVTANKQVIARAGQPLLALAARQGRQLRFEAAVGGAMPIVRAIGDGLAGDRVHRVAAILNGTTNAVLSRMEATGCSLDAALADARKRGFAEADPSLDLDGGDAAAKLAIICTLAFGLRVDASCIETRSAAAITTADFELARRGGGTIRQIAHAEYDAERSALTAWVAPVVVARTSIFGCTAGAQNAAIISGTHAGDISIAGAGAGGDATAVAVISDLLAIARDRAAVVPAPVLSTPAKIVGLEPRTSNVELRTWNPERRPSNPERRTPNVEPRTAAFPLVEAV
jgi:homoserine dehydrogenase